MLIQHSLKDMLGQDFPSRGRAIQDFLLRVPFGRFCSHILLSYISTVFLCNKMLFERFLEERVGFGLYQSLLCFMTAWYGIPSGTNVMGPVFQSYSVDHW